MLNLLGKSTAAVRRRPTPAVWLAESSNPARKDAGLVAEITSVATEVDRRPDDDPSSGDFRMPRESRRFWRSSVHARASGLRAWHKQRDQCLSTLLSQTRQRLSRAFGSSPLICLPWVRVLSQVPCPVEILNKKVRRKPRRWPRSRRAHRAGASWCRRPSAHGGPCRRRRRPSSRCSR